MLQTDWKISDRAQNDITELARAMNLDEDQVLEAMLAWLRRFFKPKNPHAPIQELLEGTIALELLTALRKHRDTEGAAAGSCLELKQEPSGLRHYLAGRPVHAGAGLQLWDWNQNRWIDGRYEWSFVRHSPAVFCTDRGELKLDDASLLRWPPRD